ncbi:unnamed protein product [Phaedon cochleariae]|uniref:Uncharacterized protein n=1 Tax=Phaedon cochleariae TaxID=80249 RepID=A0A9P0DLY9_PHACE|nr:unnamed protein product [Phaedon cochleariae]
MISKCLVLALIAHVTLARTTAGTTQNDVHETARSDSTSYLSDLKYVYKVYQECAATDTMSCLKLKLVAAMDRAARSYSNVPIFEGVSFVKDPKAVTPEEPIKSEAELEATLPRSLDEKSTALDSIIAEKVSNFIGTHTLQIKLPSSSDLKRSFEEEGRKRKGGKKGGSSGLLLLPLILGGTLIPLALGALALLAGKALIVSKLALVLAGIIGIKKLLSGGGSSGHDASHVEVYGGGHSGSGWGRSYEKEEAQKLAYSAYEPKSS